jgi:hypothetical protein
MLKNMVGKTSLLGKMAILQGKQLGLNLLTLGAHLEFNFLHVIFKIPNSMPYV